MDKVNQELRKMGLKITIPRRNVLQCLMDSHTSHLSAENIHHYLHAKNITVSLSTIYRILTQLTNVGLVNKLSLADDISVFEMSAKEHHDHIICSSCGKVTEFYDDIIENRQVEILQQNQLSLEKHIHVMYGKCTQQNCVNLKTDKQKS